MIKLYGIPLSHNVNKVRYMLEYLDLPYEFVSMNPMKGETQSPEFKKMTPTGKIPVLQIDGLNLFESSAMIRYLAKREQSPLYPQDIKRAAIVDAWEDYISIHMDNAMGRIGFNRVLAPMLGREVDEKSLQFGEEMMAKYLPVIEAQLAREPYIAGQELSIADFNLLAVLDPCEAFRVDLSPYTHISRWRNDLMKQEFYRTPSRERDEFMQGLMMKK